jgi:hypothetical protein
VVDEITARHVPQMANVELRLPDVEPIMPPDVDEPVLAEVDVVAGGVDGAVDAACACAHAKAETSAAEAITVMPARMLRQGRLLRSLAE